MNSLAMLLLINTGKVLDIQWIYSPFRGKVYDAVVESAKPNLKVLTYPNLIEQHVIGTYAEKQQF